VIGENYNENLRAAIDQAMTADAYPPARPEYPTDADIADADWHMNPCKQGHRDVGACQGKAFCHTCDETITAATTQEAFEQWNATHPATSQ
jgi:arginyl-tRNA--protein-N-Asp/Glu arginylyltransferase